MLKDYYKFGRMVQMEMLFKEFSIFNYGDRCSADLNHLHNFGRGQYWGHSYESVFNLDQCTKRCCLKKNIRHVKTGCQTKTNHNRSPCLAFTD